MKSFLKYTLATITGLLITIVIISSFLMILLIGIASFDTTPAIIENNSVLLIKLDGQIKERAKNNPFAELLGNEINEIGLDDILASIKNAKENSNIKGIYIEAGELSDASPAMVVEIRNALLDFKKSGKFIISYADNYTQGCYYICSVADTIIINPQGTINWSGLSSQTIYLKSLLQKIGVTMQVFKVGTYKAAVEPYILDDMSEANREQITTYTKEIWKVLREDVSRSRGISPKELDSLTNTPVIFSTAKEYKKNRLVDMIAYSDKIPSIISNLLHCDKDDYYIVSVKDAANSETLSPKSPSGNIIAVYYASGEIVQESESKLLSSENNINAKDVIKDLKKLAEDDDVKAVVLRVNSPGGSAYASEQIWHQVKNIKSQKPIIVSMGGYAASGGYYISCAADKIVAEPTTITGSIGIFGMFPEASELIKDKLGVNIVTVKTHEFADFGDLSRPVNENESTALQKYINNGYELFTRRCAEGRGLSQDSIKAIAEGRVWTGLHAQKIGLVDELGNLNDAIKIAKQMANLKAYSVQSYPNKNDILDNLLEEVEPSSYATSQIKENLGEYYDIFTSMKNIQHKDRIQARIPYYLKFNL